MSRTGNAFFSHGAEESAAGDSVGVFPVDGLLCCVVCRISQRISVRSDFLGAPTWPGEQRKEETRTE